jgi:hypothetical protein
MRTLFRIEGVAATFDLEHIKRHYYQSHRKLKPSSIVPVGPEFAFMSEPQRNRRVSADNERPETSVYVRFAPEAASQFNDDNTCFSFRSGHRPPD